MAVTRRVYVSLPADPWLPDNLNELKWGIVEEIVKLGFLPEIFTNPKGKPGLASAKAWNARDADQIARRCVGAAIIGMGRWRFRDDVGEPVELPTEFNHYEGALAHTLGLPRLVLVQKNVRRRVVFDMNFSGYVGEFAAGADTNWLHTDEFRVPFGYWERQLKARRDVFLGYSSKSEESAKAVKEFLLTEGATVLDWKTDFIAGRTILDQIERAAARCRGGIFLFTRDDDLARPATTDTAVPRDNVVFEAGYFVGVKGKRSVLIIREAGSKMPADLGGDIYAFLKNKSDTTPIRRTLQSFLRVL
jgi:hypothetical protein